MKCLCVPGEKKTKCAFPQIHICFEMVYFNSILVLPKKSWFVRSFGVRKKKGGDGSVAFAAS